MKMAMKDGQILIREADNVQFTIMNPKPEPLIPPPVKVSPFTHQVRGYNMALMTFGLVDPPKPKEAEK